MKGEVVRFRPFLFLLSSQFLEGIKIFSNAKTKFGKSGNREIYTKITNVSVKDKKHADLSDSVLTSSLFTSLLASASATAGAIRNQRVPVITSRLKIEFYYSLF